MEQNDAPAKEKKPRKKKVPEGPKATAYEKYEIVEINRQQIKNAPYNPRVISDKNKARLKENIRKVGLIQPIVWNERTGNIVSGHQRIEIIDALEKTYDYLIKVARVDLDEATEKQQNIFMNNPEAMGAFDMDGLEVLMKDQTLDVEMMGFDVADVYRIFGEAAVADEALAEMSNNLHKMRDGFDKIKNRSNDRNNIDYFLIVIFKNHESRLEFTGRLGFDDDRYIDGRRLLGILRPDENDANREEAPPA